VSAVAAGMLALLSCGGSERTDGAVSAVEAGGGPAVGGPAVGGDVRTVATSDLRICDGSDQIRLAFITGGGPGATPANTLLYSLGVRWLFVDGHCTYWMQSVTEQSTYDKFQNFRGYLTGVLTPTQESALFENVGYGIVGTTAGDDTVDNAGVSPNGPLQSGCRGPQAFDASVGSLWNGREMQHCSPFLEPAGWLLRAELMAGAHPMSGAVRIHIGALNGYAYPPEMPRYEWPLNSPAERFFAEGDSERSFVISDPSDAAALRALRERVLGTSSDFPEFLRLRDSRSAQNCETCLLTFRDELPFTDASGNWSPPESP
jgi:hypothetical protein